MGLLQFVNLHVYMYCRKPNNDGQSEEYAKKKTRNEKKEIFEMSMSFFVAETCLMDNFRNIKFGQWFREVGGDDVMTLDRSKESNKQCIMEKINRMSALKMTTSGLEVSLR